MCEATKDVPLEQRRGIETTDLNAQLFLVRAPIEQVAQACRQLRQVALWERDVYEREIEIQGYSFIVFQFRGHPWTVIQELSSLYYSVPLEDKDIQSLSGLLHTKALCYFVSDTSMNIGYHLYDCNESIEKLYFTHECEREMDEDDDENNDDDDMEAQGTYQFQSQLRQLKAEDIGNAYGFIDDFLREQDAYVPAFFSKVIFRVGQRITLRIKGIEHDDFERMDYVVLN